MYVGPIRRIKNRGKSRKIAPQPKDKDVAKSSDKEKEPDATHSDSSTKTVDFVLVYRKSRMNEEAFNKIEIFLFNLEQKGFQLETTPLSINEDVNFIKIYVPEKILLHFAEIFAVELCFQYIHYNQYTSKPYKFMSTDLTNPDIYGPVYPRARATLSGARPTGMTNAEKNLIIYKILRRNPYGEAENEIGFGKLISQKVLECAYPLHDGVATWTTEGPLNDRQLLAKYWSNLRCIYKQQPLDVIQGYYGPEIAFYFAWLGFYIKMLIPASIAGFSFFVLGLVSFSKTFALRSEEVCESDILLCPRCHFKNCKYEALANSCFHAQLIYLFDNPMVITFAALMSVWSTVFVELWRREESMLQIRWNLRSIETDYSMRPQFAERATHHKLSPISGNVEPYMSKKALCYRYTITFSVILLLVILMILGIFGVMIYVKTIGIIVTQNADKVTFNVGLLASFSGSLMSIMFILVFDFIYGRVAMWLTKMENPRTQVDFDNSFTYKSYAMAFVNNYCVISYLAFAKARFYTYPGDSPLWDELSGLRADLCEPSGCIIELGIQLISVLIVKKLVSTIRQHIKPWISIYVKKFRHSKVKDVKVTEQWEQDYMLNPFKKYHMMKEYMSMIIQYGYVTFFVAAFPPAPLLALVNNMLELRVDASKLTYSYRRPVAIKIPNIAAWDGILQGVTYVGVATNAFVIAFTSEFVQRVVYQHTVRYDLQGFVNSTLSAYNVSEFSMVFEAGRNVSMCYYPGKRYPPDHPKQYQLTDEHWYIIAIKFLAVVIFEHVVMLVTGFIAYVIPDIPFSVKELINYQRDQIRDIKLESLRDTYLKTQDRNKTDIFANM